MKRHLDGLIDRSTWPTLIEIEKYVDGGSGGSFKAKCKHALTEVHTIANALDAQVLNGGLGNRVAQLEKALSYYADTCRYHPSDRGHYWTFDPMTWGSTKYHQKPPENADQQPWGVAEKALNLPEPYMIRNVLEYPEQKLPGNSINITDLPPGIVAGFDLAGWKKQDGTFVLMNGEGISNFPPEIKCNGMAYTLETIRELSDDPTTGFKFVNAVYV